MRERTTKYVTGAFKLTFYGDYYDSDEVQSVFQRWIDIGLEDRDDLCGWDFTVVNMDEVAGDPEGYDS